MSNRRRSVAWPKTLLLLLVMHMTGIRQSNAESMALPQPLHQGATLEKALAQRRTVREFAPRPIGLPALSQLLWSAQGITHPGGYRTAPSAGALYPLEIDVVAGDITGLEAGVYRYLPDAHRLRRQQRGDRRLAVADAALQQQWLSRAAVLIIIRGVYRRTALKYGEQARRYVQLEAGAVTQNILLQAVSLGLGAATVGAFRSPQLEGVIGGEEREEPLVIIPVGHPS
jgi:SagB-type dehydrogenase family enzyme